MPEVGSKEHRKRVTEWHMARSVEEMRRLLGELEMQGDWVSWQGVMERDLSWNTALYRLKFLLQGMSRVAPSPDHLRRMNYIADDRCPLCAHPRCDLLHIESYCGVALEQGRYTWRHNEVLRPLHHFIGLRARAVKKPAVAKPRVMVFVKEGEARRQPSERKKTPALLDAACDWHITVDLPEFSYRFPVSVAVTGKRPDLVLWSVSLKLIILIELTVPAERNVMQAYDRKLQRYGGPGGLEGDCRDAGWAVELMPMEVGTLGFISQSTVRACKKLGAWSNELRRALEDVALRASYVLFLERKSPGWCGGQRRLWRPRAGGPAA